MRARAHLVLVALVAATTAVAGPPRATATPTPDRLVAAAAGWIAWLVGLLVVTALALAVAARGRGRIAAVSRRLLATYPRPIRRWAVALATGAVLTAATTPAVAAPAAGSATADHHRGTDRPPPAAPLDWPTGAPSHTGASRTAEHAGSAATVVVRRGDCLWSIAQRSLGHAASPTSVAAAWPRWWAVNRDVIGPDPGLLRPGQHLRAPARGDERKTR